MKTEMKHIAAIAATAIWADGEYDEAEKIAVEEIAEAFELDAAANTAVPYTVAEPMNAAAATVDAVVAAATPLPTIHTAVAAAAKPPQVTTVATAQAATTAAPRAQCHHASPVGSILLTGLLPQ